MVVVVGFGECFRDERGSGSPSGKPMSCPDCGCSWVESCPGTVGGDLGDVFERVECGMCGRRWLRKVRVGDKVVVEETVLRCPYCESRRTWARKRDGRRRLRQCRDCGQWFHSVEREEDGSVRE